MLDAIVVIPARLHSSRLPNKPLLPLGGRPLILQVVDQVRRAKARVERIIVATDAPEIAKVVEEAGVEVFLSDKNHSTGTDRVAEVAEGLENKIIVNVQGDEPFLSAACLKEAIQMIEDGNTMGSCMTSFSSLAEFQDPGNVKVLTDCKREALYFSRSPIPYQQNADFNILDQPSLGRHLGIYSYKRETLLSLAKSTPVHLEEIESLEQLRAIFLGYPIHMRYVQCDSFGINTAEDLSRAQVRWEKNARKRKNA